MYNDIYLKKLTILFLSGYKNTLGKYKHSQLSDMHFTQHLDIRQECIDIFNKVFYNTTLNVADERK